MSATIGKVYVDAVITDERYKECMALVQEANERIDELREQLDTAKHNRVRNAREYARLCHENDRLRELLRVAITYCVNGYCGKDDGGPLRLTDYDCQLLTKASELGVEVDG